MKHPPFILAALAVCALLFTPHAQGDDLAAMAGTWRVESAEAGGKNIASDDLKEIVVTISGDHYELKTKDGMDAGTIKLDETQKPKTMDATDTEGLDVGKVLKAIYELSGDTMRVCYALDGGARPTEFATREGLPWLIVTYKREK